MKSVLISDAPALAQPNLASAATSARKQLATNSVSCRVVDNRRAVKHVVIPASFNSGAGQPGIHLDRILLIKKKMDDQLRC
jgi:hypothetical protein